MTHSKQVLEKPYGAWKSQISIDSLIQSSNKIIDIYQLNGQVYWLESRPQEKGRCVICTKDSNGEAQSIIPEGYSVNSRVHEYGGGAFAFIDEQRFVFVNDEDQNIYVGSLPICSPSEKSNDAVINIEALTKSNKVERFADLNVSHCGQFLVCVRERHLNNSDENCENSIEVINDLVVFQLDAENSMHVVHSGQDFYMAPKFNHDGKQLAWISWNHPNMPWDHTELWVATRSSNQFVDCQKVETGQDASILQPEWDSNDLLYFVSDQSDWWNIYRLEEGVIHALAPTNIEFGFPHWVFGMTAYRVINQDEIVAIGYLKGTQHLYHIEVASGHMEELALPCNNYHYCLQHYQDQLFLLGSSATDPLEIIQYDLRLHDLTVVQQIATLPVPEQDISVAQQIEVPTSNNMRTFAYYYQPKNSAHVADLRELPPAIVMSHGGPTGQTDSSFNLEIQFWTSRGFAVIDVNYRGSTGYGSLYRQSLKGNWGVYDVDDCIAVVEYLTALSKIDRNRVAIRGGSAGGYTTLAALTREQQPFSAGVSRYGVSDLLALASECHKFEARYLDSVIGKLPEMRSIYETRSPINNLHNLSTPMLLLQGLKDKVVPPNQAEKMVEQLEKKQQPYAYITFENEAHGFKAAESKKKALLSELSFYQQVWGIKKDDGEDDGALEIQFLN
jgi:dipeptidyl aminopeptidase/acylaminoacyl peptidase